MSHALDQVLSDLVAPSSVISANVDSPVLEWSFTAVLLPSEDSVVNNIHSGPSLYMAGHTSEMEVIWLWRTGSPWPTSRCAKPSHSIRVYGMVQISDYNLENLVQYNVEE